MRFLLNSENIEDTKTERRDSRSEIVSLEIRIETRELHTDQERPIDVYINRV